MPKTNNETEKPESGVKKQEQQQKLEGWKSIGIVTHYYGKISVAAIKLSDKLRVGDLIRVKGHTTDFEQRVESMQIHHQVVKEAEPNTEVGIKLNNRVREGDIVYVKEVM